MFDLVLIQVQAILRQVPQGDRWFVAYSGGMDSSVLLHLLYEIQKILPNLKLSAIHINHQLNPQADAWEKHCLWQCEQYQIPCVTTKIQVERGSGESLEAAARATRYLALQQRISKDAILCTAHHQRDQAETFLLQALRGAGVKGLASMPVVTPCGLGYLARPLLRCGYDAVLAYARENQLTWVEDDSNQNMALRRNALRHQVFPVIQQHWPAYSKTLARSAQLCAQVQTVLDFYMSQELENCRGHTIDSLSCKKLLSLPDDILRACLRAWIAKQGFSLPSHRLLQKIVTDVLLASAQTNPLLSWVGCEIRRYHDQLYIMRPLPSRVCQAVPWQLSMTCALPLGVLQTHRCLGAGLAPKFADEPLTIAFRRGGEKILFHNQHQRVKNLLRSLGVLPWLREFIPFIYLRDDLLAIGDIIIADRAQAAPEELGYQLQWLS